MRRRTAVRILAPIVTLALIFGLTSVIVSMTKALEDSTETSKKTQDDLVAHVSSVTNLPFEDAEERLSLKNVMVITDDYEFLDSLSYVSSYSVISEHLVMVFFSNTANTAEAYLELRDHYGSNKVFLDSLAEAKTNTFVGYDTNDVQYGWGSISTGMLDYANEIASTTSDRTVRVAVIDSGIRTSHNAFKYQTMGDRLDLSRGGSMIEILDNSDPEDYDYNVLETPSPFTLGENYDNYFHGTLVASAVSESTPSNVKIVPLKAGPIDSYGSLSTNAVIYGLAYIDNNDAADVVNLSLGLDKYIAGATTEEMDEYWDTIESEVMSVLKADGHIVIASSGNEADDPNDGNADVKWPACSPSVITVGSVDSLNNRSSFSNYGQSLDFVAPGENVYLASRFSDNGRIGVSNSSITDSTEATLEKGLDGTSISSPYIAAAVAEILLENPDYNFDQVYNELRLNSVDLGSAGFDTYYGYGSLDFNINRLADITFANTTYSTTDWTNQDITATVSATTGANSFTGYTFSNGDQSKTIQENWNTYSDGAMTQTISQNGTYTMWLKNSNNQIKATVLTVDNIDKTNPSVSDVNYTSISGTSGTLTAAVSDEDRGIKSVSAEYCTVDSDCETVNLSAPTTGNQWSAELDNLTPGHPYTVTVDVEDNAGNTNSLSGNFDTAAHTDHGGDSGNTGDDSGNTGGDSGNTGGDSGNTGGDSGNTGGDSGNTGGDSGNTGGDSGNTGNNDNTGNNTDSGNNSGKEKNSDKNTSSNDSPNTSDNKNKFLFLGLGSFTLVGTGAFVAIKKRR